MKKRYRWLMLFLLNLVVCGNYFCYDYPAYLEVQIEDQFDIPPSRYGLLYSSYGVPNLILPFFTGILYDKYGSRICMTCTTCLILIGQGIFMLGGYLLSFNVMLIGRFIYGSGCENFIASIVIVEWFKEFELSFAMGMSEFLPLIASFMSGVLIPRAFNAGDDPSD
jgi:MFS family permease